MALFHIFFPDSNSFEFKVSGGYRFKGLEYHNAKLESRNPKLATGN